MLLTTASPSLGSIATTTSSLVVLGVEGSLWTGAVRPVGMDPPLVTAEVGGEVLRAELHLQVDGRGEAVAAVGLRQGNGQREGRVADPAVSVVIDPGHHPAHLVDVHLYGDLFPAVRPLDHVVANHLDLAAGPVSRTVGVVGQLHFAKVHRGVEGLQEVFELKL